jgi:hypothetical protein
MSFQGTPYPGPTPTYAPTHPPPAPLYNQTKPEDQHLTDDEVKSPYREGRFKSKNKINDIGFLVFFVAVVCYSIYPLILFEFMGYNPGAWFCRSFWRRPE